MEIKIDPLQPPGSGEGLLGEAHDLKNHSLFKPVEKVEQDVSRELKKEDEYSNEKSPETKTPVDREHLENLVEETNDILSGIPAPVDIDLQVNEETGDVVVSVRNKETEEIIRQIPPEEMIKVRERMMELRGVLYDQKA